MSGGNPYEDFAAVALAAIKLRFDALNAVRCVGICDPDRLVTWVLTGSGVLGQAWPVHLTPARRLEWLLPVAALGDFSNRLSTSSDPIRSAEALLDWARAPDWRPIPLLPPGPAARRVRA